MTRATLVASRVFALAPLVVPLAAAYAVAVPADASFVDAAGSQYFAAGAHRVTVERADCFAVAVESSFEAALELGSGTGLASVALPASFYMPMWHAETKRWERAGLGRHLEPKQIHLPSGCRLHPCAAPSKNRTSQSHKCSLSSSSDRELACSCLGVVERFRSS